VAKGAGVTAIEEWVEELSMQRKRTVNEEKIQEAVS
jgi:hypothetical protein